MVVEVTPYVPEGVRLLFCSQKPHGNLESSLVPAQARAAPIYIYGVNK